MPSCQVTTLACAEAVASRLHWRLRHCLMCVVGQASESLARIASPAANACQRRRVRQVDLLLRLERGNRLLSYLVYTQSKSATKQDKKLPTCSHTLSPVLFLLLRQKRDRNVVTLRAFAASSAAAAAAAAVTAAAVVSHSGSSFAKAMVVCSCEQRILHCSCFPCCSCCRASCGC